MSMAVPDSATTGADSPNGPGDAKRGDLRNSAEGVGVRERPRPRPRPLGDKDLGPCVSTTARCVFGVASANADPHRGECCPRVGDGA